MNAVWTFQSDWFTTREMRLRKREVSGPEVDPRLQFLFLDRGTDRVSCATGEPAGSVAVQL